MGPGLQALEPLTGKGQRQSLGPKGLRAGFPGEPTTSRRVQLNLLHATTVSQRLTLHESSLLNNRSSGTRLPNLLHWRYESNFIAANNVPWVERHGWGTGRVPVSFQQTTMSLKEPEMIPLVFSTLGYFKTPVTDLRHPHLIRNSGISEPCPKPDASRLGPTEELTRGMSFGRVLR